MLSTKFGVSWPFGSGEEAKYRLSRWLSWWPSWISYQNDFSYFDLLVTPMFPIKFQDNWTFISVEKKQKKIFKMAAMPAILDFPLEQIQLFFLSTSHPTLPTKFQVNWPFVSREEAKNRFSRWWPWQPSLVLDQNDFNYFCSIRHPNVSYQVSSQLAFRFKRRRGSEK